MAVGNALNLVEALPLVVFRDLRILQQLLQAIVRVAPDGTIDTVIEMPASNVTTCTFGGERLNTLYVTSAAAGTQGEDLAGGLFAIETDVCGQPENRFSISSHYPQV